MSRFRFSLIQLVLYGRGWFFDPKSYTPDEPNGDPVPLMLSVLAGELLIATYVWSFLWGHGQL